MDVPEGVRVQVVVPGGPADAAGLRVGDTLVAVGRTPVESVGGLAADIRAHRPGDEVKIRTRHDGREQIFAVTLGAFGVESAATP
jgi:putative serine protease PepD